MSDAVYCECGESFEDGAALGEHIRVEGEGHAPAEEPAADPDQSDAPDLSIAWTGGTTYAVYSPSEEGHSNAYVVELRGDGGPRCTCSHATKKGNGSTEACKHIREAIKAHTSHPDFEQTTQTQLISLVREAYEMQDQVRDLLEMAETSRSAHAELHEEADPGPQEADDGTPQPASEAQTAEAESAAQTLQDAFDDVLDDMQVQTSAGHVWFKTGYDTEEEWPFPGGDETFKVITSPDCVKYVHDGSDEWADSPHPLYADMPGEYFKNALEPSDVEEYISEVLE